MISNEIIKAAILGHAIGDALGVPAEFIPREKLQKHPITDMIGYGSHDVPKGSWSDDTSMELCTLNSISKNGKIDLDDIMIEFGKWVEDGYMTPHGTVFDIGRTCLRAIMDYHRGKDVYHCGGDREYANGNGSLMRILPVCLYNYLKRAERNVAINNIHSVSALTHAHERSCIACGIYDFVVQELISTPKKSSVKKALAKAKEYYIDTEENKNYDRLYDPNFELTAEKDIKSSGYVVDTLEAAIWCLLNTDNYKECVLKAINLGQDTDTVAAVAGGLAGIIYGYESIPTEWLDCLVKKDEILNMCSAFYDAVITDNRQFEVTMETLLNKAIIFATEAHVGQFRKGTDIPYILHPLEAATIVGTMTTDDEIIAGAVLHDVVEDTATTINEIKELFGDRVAALVASESENKREHLSAESTWKIRKQETLDHLKTAPLDVKMITLGDKLSNIRAIHRDYNTIGDELWQRFNQKDKNEHCWYYQGIADCLSELSDYPAYQEYCELVKKTFTI